MGISVKTAGITLGGLTALWLVNKGLNILSRTIDTMAESSKWKAYYKYGEHEHAVPPGYARYGDWRSPEQQEADRKEEAAEELKNSRKKVDMKPIGESLENIAKAYFRAKGIDLDTSDKCNNGAYRCNYSAHTTDTDTDGLDEAIEKEFGTEEDESFAAQCSEETPDGKIIEMPVKSEETDGGDAPQK